LWRIGLAVKQKPAKVLRPFMSLFFIISILLFTCTVMYDPV
jgi:hypothetical protein